ncbi:uncharacterized protein LOC131953104 [Physella acuta]|uniref:uncharacterized protein LOC131953104 n=1 Tax=Physella acuta TaxID=109671 RepID=UPI0027DD032A|nr:uncharacterized protein LOC131953104 [Physella acuta]XP_059172125.1 uncharacterized protein LOC131953104 [Physella acuta]
MTRKQFKRMLLRILLLSLKGVLSEIVCAEEETCRIVHKAFVNPRFNITASWYRHNQIVSNCTQNKECETYAEFKHFTNSTYSLVNNYLYNTLELNSSDRNTDFDINGEWVLIVGYTNISTRSNFTIITYRMIKDASCVVEATMEKGVWLICNVPKAYPETLCTFIETHGNKNYENVTYKNLFLLHKPYMSNNCSIRLDVTDKVENKFEFIVGIYPNISYNGNDRNFKKNISVSYCIGPPRITHNCPDEVLEGESFSCKCYKVDTYNNTVKIKVKQGEKLISDSTADNEYIIKTVGEEFMDITCYGVNDLNWQSNLTKYCPKLRRKYFYFAYLYIFLYALT